MRIALALLMAVHGLIHLLGFAHSWQLADISQFSGKTLFTLPAPFPRVVGLVWLLVAAGFVAAAVTMLFRFRACGAWWLLAAGAIIVSQLLIIYAWPDAKAGTLVNIVLVLPVVMAGADARFARDTRAQVRALFRRAAAGKTATKRAAVGKTAAERAAVGKTASGGEDVGVVTAKALAPLPPPVRRWLEGAGVVGKPIPRTVRLKQRGALRIAPDKDPVQATAHQYFRVDEPEFIWSVRLRMMHVLPVVGRDTYRFGRGRMLIKLAALFPVVDAADEKIDQGALLRFLAETAWFPAAALSPYIHWEPIDATTAKATMTYGGVSGSGVFSFDREGRFLGLTAKRYFGGGADAKKQRWEITVKEWNTLDGCRVPVRGAVRWKLPEGEFTFYRWQVTALEYDPPGPYPPR